MRWGVALLVAANLWLGSVNGFAEPVAPPAAAFGQVPAIQSVALSPSGQLIAWIDSSNTTPMIHIFDLDKRATLKRVNAPTDLKLRDLDWADDEILFIHGSVTRVADATDARSYELFRTVALDVASGKARILLHTGGSRKFVTGSRVQALRTATPKTVIMSSWDWSSVNYKQETGSRLSGGRKDDGWTYNLYTVDTRSGEGRLLEAGTPFTSDWMVDASGAPVARSEWEAERGVYTVWARRGGGYTQIFRLDTRERPDMFGVTRDGSALLMRAAIDGKERALWRVPVDGTAPQLAINDEVIGLVRDPYSWEVWGAWTGGLAPDVRWLDEQAGKRARSLQKTFSGKYALMTGRSVDGSRALVNVASHATPNVYYIVDFKRGTADIVGEQYPALANVALGEVRHSSYKARDGYEIPAYLTVPPAVKAEKLPLVVLPHGGPEAQDEPVFDYVAQFLATRGYAVLQPQYRGSTGVSVAHQQAGYRQWGLLMQDDITDGVRAMIEQGIADASRVCIAGMSYGGYAALAGVTFTPDLYACAISINGVSDLPNLLGYAQRSYGAESDSVAYWKEHIGPASSPDVIAKSPNRAARNVRAPVLLMHGIDDTVVPVTQSQAMIRALGGAPHQLIELPGEDHWLSRSETRIRVLTEMERFLAKHLPVERVPPP